MKLALKRNNNLIKSTRIALLNNKDKDLKNKPPKSKPGKRWINKIESICINLYLPAIHRSIVFTEININSYL